jgi:hypothetical protein
MPVSQAAPLHILPAPELKRRAESGYYHTIAACKEDLIRDMGLNNLFRQKADVQSCTVFWDWKGKGS